MIQRIVLRDFMAHKHTELVLGPGVTALTGPNNSGKSAIVEALRCVAANPTPRHVIRHGAKQASVEVHLESGAVVTWARKKNTAWYELLEPGRDEPEYFRKLGRGMVPDEIRDALRLDPVDLESGTSVDVHVGDQKKPIFLLDADAADARMAEFFAASSESAHLLAMQKALQGRNREAKTRERTLLARMDELAAGLDRLAGLPEITRLGLEARELGGHIGQTEKDMPALERTIDGQLRLGRQGRRASVRSEALAPLAPPPELLDAAGLERLALGLERVRCEEDRVRAKREALAALNPAPEPLSTTDIKVRLQQYIRLEKNGKSIGKKALALAGLQAPPEPAELQPLSGLCEQLGQLGRSLKQARKAAEVRAGQLEMQRERIRETVERVGRCPLCNNRMNAAAFIGEPGPDDAPDDAPDDCGHGCGMGGRA